MKKYFQEVYDFYTKHGFKKPKGASNEEIGNLETRIGFKLPEAYKEFLRFMGNDVKGSLRGTDCFIDGREIDREDLQSCLDLNELTIKLPENPLVFFNHQGYYLAWFDLSLTEDDPTCYYYMEATETELKQSTLSEFMTREILQCAEITIELGTHQPWWRFW